MYLCSQSEQKMCGLAFGLSQADTSHVLSAGRSALLCVLKTMPDAEVRWPSVAEMVDSAARVEAVYGIPNIFAFVDGLNLHMQSPADPIMQAAYYNGWKESVFASSVFVTDSHGLYIWVRCNAPGSWHDAAIAAPLVRSHYALARLLHTNLTIPLKSHLTNNNAPPISVPQAQG
jgi:hypothetical protein